MKKKILSVLLCSALCLSMSACSSGTSAKSAAPAEQTEQTVEESNVPAAEAAEPAAEAAEPAAEATEPAAEAAEPAAEAAEPAQAEGTESAQAEAQQTGDVVAFGDIPSFTIDRFYFSENEDYYTIARGSYDRMHLTRGAEEVYPELSQSFEALFEEQVAAVKEQYNEVMEGSRTVWEDWGDDPYDFPNGDVTMRIEPVRQDSKVMSFYISCYVFNSGAVHGFTGNTAFNFDTATGKRLSLEDVFTDIEALGDAVAQNLRTAADGSLIEDEWGNLPGYFKDGRENLAWVIDNEGVTIRFDPYAVASYAAGMVEAKITYAEYPSLFTEQFAQQYKYDGGAYVRHLNPYATAQVDLEGDGQTELLTISGVYDQYDPYACDGVTVTVGEAACTQDDYFYSLDPVLVHTEDGKNYVYAETTSDNDYKNLIVFEITDGVPAVVGNLSRTGYEAFYHYESDNWEENHTTYVPVLDPSSFGLSTRMDLMSTYSAMRNYKVGEDGMPAPMTDYYEIDAAYELITKVPLTVGLVDTVSGEATGETVDIPEATRCSLWHTNGVDTVDLMLEDGRTVRVNVSSQWPQTVNGIDLEEAFDGTLFAG